MGSENKSVIHLNYSDAKHHKPQIKNEVYEIEKEKFNFFNIFNFRGYDMPSSIDDLLKKKEVTNSAEQKTPFNVNRNFIVLFYFFLIVLTNRLFFGWPNLSNLLFRDDAYIWKCEKNQNGSYDRSPDKRYVCENQDKAVQTIFVYGSSAYFSFSFFNGLIVDYLGSRISMLLGHVLNLIGWVLLLLSNENFDAYVIGGVFISASIDLGSFSSLNASGLFPNNENLIVNIISGAGSLSTGTMLILDILITQLDLSFKNFMLLYIFISVGFFFILTILIYPRTRYYRQYEFDNYNKNEKNSIKNINEMVIIKKNTQNDSFVERINSKDNEKITNVNAHEREHTDLYENEIIKIENNEYMNNKDIYLEKNKKKSLKSSSLRDMFNICTSAHFICLLIYGPLNAIYNTFYYSVVENILSKDKNDILGYIMPFSFIPCILLGNITDKIGIMIMFVYELIFALFMYAFSYSTSNFFQWLSVISNTLYSACANGQLWTFISYTFSSKYHSTLIGLLNFVGGIVSFSRLLLLEWAKYTKYDFTYINLLIIGLILVNVIVTCFIFYIRKVKGEKVKYGDEVAS